MLAWVNWRLPIRVISSTVGVRVYEESKTIDHDPQKGHTYLESPRGVKISYQSGWRQWKHAIQVAVSWILVSSDHYDYSLGLGQK